MVLAKSPQQSAPSLHVRFPQVSLTRESIAVHCSFPETFRENSGVSRVFPGKRKKIPESLQKLLTPESQRPLYRDVTSHIICARAHSSFHHKRCYVLLQDEKKVFLHVYAFDI